MMFDTFIYDFGACFLDDWRKEYVRKVLHAWFEWSNETHDMSRARNSR